MDEKLAAIVQKGKMFLGKVEKKTWRLLLIGLLVIVAGAIIVAVILNNKPYAVLFTGLTGDEARAIVTYLEENGTTDYRLENGDTILVPESKETSLKARLLVEGYPQSGFLYETYFGHISTMSTESERNTAFLYELQDRMAATIRCLDNVKDATVTISMGEDNSSILAPDNVTKASAFAMVTTMNGQKLSAQQAVAIRNLVVRAVQGLEFEQISIVDSLGNVYSGEEGLSSALDASQLKLELEAQVNNQVRTEIITVLSPLFGADNVKVSVSSTVELSHSVGESTTYGMPEGAPEGQGLLGSKIFEQDIINGGVDAAGGVVGTGTNSDLPSYVETAIENAGTDSPYIHNSGTEEYKVNENKEQTERIAGFVSDVMVAVSINSSTAGNVNTAALRSHVARAAGIESDVETEKISILPAPFYDADALPGPTPPTGLIGLPVWAIYAAAAGVVLLLILLLIIAILSKKRRKRKARQLQAMLDGAAATDAGLSDKEGADIMSLKTEKSMELRKDIRDFAESSPEIAAQMVKSWLKGEGSGSG